MNVKRIVIFTLVACLLFATPVSASKAKWIKKTGRYEASIWSKNLKGKNKKKYFKKHIDSWERKMGYIIKTKLKKRVYTVWGTMLYKHKGKKKHLKYKKYKFRLSRKFVLLGWMPNGTIEGFHLEKAGKKETKRLMIRAAGNGYTMYVKNGVLYKMIIGD